MARQKPTSSRPLNDLSLELDPAGERTASSSATGSFYLLGHISVIFNIRAKKVGDLVLRSLRIGTLTGAGGLFSIPAEAIALDRVDYDSSAINHLPVLRPSSCCAEPRLCQGSEFSSGHDPGTTVEEEAIRLIGGEMAFTRTSRTVLRM